MKTIHIGYLQPSSNLSEPIGDLSITLDENPSTGYRWVPSASSGVTFKDSGTPSVPSHKPGAPAPKASRSLHVHAPKPGSLTLRLVGPAHQLGASHIISFK